MVNLPPLETVIAFRVHKLKPRSIPRVLGQLKLRLAVYPMCTAECERGFSAMMTSVRSNLLIPTLSSFLFICVNGPPLKHFDSRKYVIS